MATHLGKCHVTLDSTDVSDQVINVTINAEVDSHENTSLTSTGHTFTGGLENNTVDIELFIAYGAAEIEATLDGLVGTTFNAVIYPTTSNTASATNPGYTLTGCFLPSFQPINASVGELVTTTITLTGGTLTRAVA